MGWKRTLVWLVARNTTIGRNYLGTGEEHRRRKLGQITIKAYREAQKQKGKRDIQYEDEGYKVKVTNGYSRDLDRYTTDIIIVPRFNNPYGHHQHVIFDEYGNEIMNEWRTNRR